MARVYGSLNLQFARSDYGGLPYRWKRGKNLRIDGAPPLHFGVVGSSGASLRISGVGTHSAFSIRINGPILWREGNVLIKKFGIK